MKYPINDLSWLLSTYAVRWVAFAEKVDGADWGDPATHATADYLLQDWQAVMRLNANIIPQA